MAVGPIVYSYLVMASLELSLVSIYVHTFSTFSNNASYCIFQVYHQTYSIKQYLS